MNFFGLFNAEPTELLARLLALVVALSIHEFAHAWTAFQFGDNTARNEGRLTLNPLAHLDPIGSLMMLFIGFGWAKPVPVNPYVLQRRSNAALMWVSLAGPFSNFLLAILAAIPFRAGLLDGIDYSNNSLGTFVVSVLFYFIVINLGLMLFNLIPLAPLDGEKILEFFLPPRGVQILDNIRPYGPMILLVILFVFPYLGFDVLGWIIGPPMNALLTLLVG